MDSIITATQKEFPCDYLSTIPYPEQMFLRVVKVPLVDVAAVFSNKAETKEIIYGDRVLTGYTRLIALISEGNAIKVHLGREA